MAQGEDSRAQQRHSLRERSRQWFLTVGTTLALLATVIGFLSDSVGVVEFLRNMGASSPPTAIVLHAETPGPPSTPSFALTPTATAVPTDIPIVTSSPTPLPVVAGQDERLLIVAQFSNFATDSNFNVAGRIHEALESQVEAAELEDTRVAVWPEAVEDTASATQILDATGAALVIWGEYDSGRVRVRFSLAGGGTEMDWQRLLGAPTELSTTINLDVPREAQALALMALGRLYRRAGNMERARAAFAQALAQSPNDLDTVATLTFYLAVLDAAATPPDLDGAIEGYSQVIEMRPAWFNARYNRGLAYLTRYWMTAEPANLDSAIGDFTWTIDADSHYAEAFINRAIAHFARNGEGDMDAAIDDLSAALEYSPFTGEISQERVWGRGAVDTKATLAVVLALLEQMQAAGQRPRPSLLIGATVDEEFGATGAPAFASWIARQPFSVSQMVVAEPTLCVPVIGHRGVARFELMFNGKSAHSSQPDQGCNAIVGAARTVVAFANEHQRLQTLPATMLGHPSLTATIIQGGTGNNVVPDHCTLFIDRRIVDGEDPGEVIDQLYAMAQHEAALPVELTRQLEIHAFLQPPDAPFIQQMAVWSESTPFVAPYGTNAWAYRNLPCETVIIGPGSIDQAHGAREWVELAELEKIGHIYAHWWGINTP